MLSSAELRSITAKADPTQPPAIMQPAAEGSLLLTLRVRTSVADQIADLAQAEGTTQKVIITRARSPPPRDPRAAGGPRRPHAAAPALTPGGQGREIK